MAVRKRKKPAVSPDQYSFFDPGGDLPPLRDEHAQLKARHDHRRHCQESLDRANKARAEIEADLARVEEDAERVRDFLAATFQITLNQTVFQDRQAAGEWLRDRVLEAAMGVDQVQIELGEMAGFGMVAIVEYGEDGILVSPWLRSGTGGDERDYPGAEHEFACSSTADPADITAAFEAIRQPLSRLVPVGCERDADVAVGQNALFLPTQLRKVCGGEPVTMECAAEIFGGTAASKKKRRVRTDDILDAVVSHLGVTLDELMSLARRREVVRGRHIGMFLARDLTDNSLPEIARRFGLRDHSSVVHAVRRIGERMETDAQLAADIAVIRSHLK